MLAVPAAGGGPRPSARLAGVEPPRPTSPLSRRRFLQAAALAGAGGAWFGGAHLLLRDDRWTPNRSFWVARGRAPTSPPLRGRAAADVAIVGAGVTGLSAAVHALLRSPSLKVVVLEAEYAGFGATGRSGGVLGDGTEMGTPEGTEDNARFAVDLIDRFAIPCDLDRERTQIDPYLFSVGLKRAAEGLGASVHEGTRVLSLREGGAAVTAAGDGFSLQAARVVVAANGYMPRLGVAADRIFPVHTGAAVTVPLPPAVLDALPDEIHLMTSREMYVWGRKAPGGRLLVGAGAEYFYDNGLNHRGERPLFAALRRFIVRVWPALASYPFEHAWTGPMGCTADQEPIIGSAGDRVLFCGGYTGHGLAMGARAGAFLAAMLDGTPPPAWLLRDTPRLPPEPFRYVGVNMVINLMNLGLYSMPKRDEDA
jgi:glycine/D-amino acid oxidase-like deaminating enzyme